MSADNRRKPDEKKQNNPEKLSVEVLHACIAEDRKKAARNFFMALSALVVMVGISVAWLVSNHRVNATGMNIQAASAEDFQLASKGKRQDAEQNKLKNEDSQNILNNGTAYLINSDGKMIAASDDTNNTEIYYAGDDYCTDFQEFADRNNADEVIVLLSSFDVDSSGGDGSLNPNSTYNNWNWILVRTKGGKWQHIDHGY